MDYVCQYKDKVGNCSQNGMTLIRNMATGRVEEMRTCPHYHTGRCRLGEYGYNPLWYVSQQIKNRENYGTAN